MRASIAIAALALVTACAEYDMPGEFADTGDAIDTGSADFDTGGPDEDGLATEPAWFRLEGVIAIADGEAQASGSSLSFTFVADTTDGEAAPADTGIALPCATTPAVLSMTAVEPPEDADTLLGWWAVELDTADNDCPWALPEQLRLGVGAWDPQLESALVASDDVQAAPGDLYGAYVQYGNPAGPRWAWGAAGTDAHYDGTATPVEAAPLPSGTYRLEALYLLPWSAPE